MLFSTQFEKKKAEDKEMNQNSRSVLRTAPHNYEITSAMVMINDIIVKNNVQLATNTIISYLFVC